MKKKILLLPLFCCTLAVGAGIMATRDTQKSGSDATPLPIFGATAQAQAKPNVLIILADDLGYGDVGFTGSTDIQTPQIDQLAANGVVCTNGYVTHAFCGPSRAGLVTGRYQGRFGMDVNLPFTPYDTYNGLPVEEQTFGDRLKKQGYNTGLIGKWHLGAAPPFHPNNRGFDYFYGFLSGGHSYLPEEVDNTAAISNKAGEPIEYILEGYRLPLVRNDHNAELNEYLTTSLSRDAAKFVKEADKPFCLYLSYNAPHAPLQAPAATIEKYKNIADPDRRTYAAMIDEMDKGIGMVVDSLKASGKFDNTLIFFLSDNGGSMAVSKTTGKPYSSSGPLRGGKGSMYEGGAHVPFVVQWPAGLAKGKKFDGLVSALDITATATAVAGGDASDKSLEGVNLIPYFNGQKQGSPHDALFWRQGSGALWGVRNLDTKYLVDGRGKREPELYAIDKDLSEKNNIIAQSPEKRAAMAKLWNDWNAGNKNNAYMQPAQYHAWRAEMFKEKNDSLKDNATKRKVTVID